MKAKTFLKGFFSKFSWYSGLITGAIFSTLVVWGAPLVISNVFNSGDTISASEVNANFAQIQDRINENDHMLVITMGSGNQAIASATSDNLLLLDTVLKETMPGFNPANSQVVVQADGKGLYSVYFQSGFTTATCGLKYNLIINGTNFSTIADVYTVNEVDSSSNKVILNVGDIITITVDEYYSMGGCDVMAAKTFLIIERETVLP